MLLYLISVGAGGLTSGLDSCTLPIVSSPRPLCCGTFLDSLFITPAEKFFAYLCDNAHQNICDPVSGGHFRIGKNAES